MKLFSTLSALILSIGLVTAQDATTPAKELTAEQKVQQEKAKALFAAFNNLPEKTRLEYLKTRGEALVLFQEKRIFETFGLLSQLEYIFPDDPQVVNLRGACYVEIRDFKKAREQFHKGIELAGENFNILFNLAELSFVSKEWDQAIKDFDSLLEKYKDTVLFTKQLIEFKTYISLLKASDDTSLSDEQRSAYLKRSESYVGRYTYRDDSPYFYYVNSIIAYRKKDNEESSKWLNRGRRVFSSTPQILAAWEDTMIESEMLSATTPSEAPAPEAAEAP